VHLYRLDNYAVTVLNTCFEVSVFQSDALNVTFAVSVPEKLVLVLILEGSVLVLVLEGSVLVLVLEGSVLVLVLEGSVLVLVFVLEGSVLVLVLVLEKVCTCPSLVLGSFFLLCVGAFITSLEALCFSLLSLPFTKKLKMTELNTEPERSGLLHAYYGQIIF